MKADADNWVEFGRRLGVEVIAPAEIELAGIKAHFTALLPQFGGPKGMIVDADWKAIEPHKAALLVDGYGYSCVSRSDPGRLDDPEEMAAAREMFADWSWNSASPKPAWLEA